MTKIVGSSDFKPEPGRVIEPRLSGIPSMKKLEEEQFTAYLIGPVYVYSGIGEDLVAAFASEPMRDRPSPLLGTTAKFERAVLDNCGEWNFIVGIMDTPSFQFFKTWMLALQPINRQKKEFAVVRHYRAPILDPFELDQTRRNVPTAIDLFCLSTMRGQIVPYAQLDRYEKAGAAVRLKALPPDPEVIALGKTALGVLNNL